MRLVFYSSKFCDPCIATRAVIGEAARLVPAAEVVEPGTPRRAAGVAEVGPGLLTEDGRRDRPAPRPRYLKVG